MPGTLIFQMGCFVVAEFLLTSASRGPSAIAELIVSHWVHFAVHSLDLFVFICVNFVFLFFILHICCVIVSTVGGHNRIEA